MEKYLMNLEINLMGKLLGKALMNFDVEFDFTPHNLNSIDR